MADDELNRLIRRTQEKLGVLVKKPPLTEKLLSKPPFRFLHDVILAVIKQTNYAPGLYDGDELDAQKVNAEKDTKLIFLQKMLDVIQLSLKENLSVKPSKIIAGQEPERTNEFLQALAKAASDPKLIDASKEIVRRVLDGEKVPNFSGGGGSKKSSKTAAGASASAGSNAAASAAPNGESGGSAGSNKENRTEKEKSGSSKERKKDEKESSSKDSTKKRSSSKDNKDSTESKTKTEKRSESKERSSSKNNTDNNNDKKSSSKTGDQDLEENAKKKSKRSSSKSADTEKKSKDDDDEEEKRKTRHRSSEKSNSAGAKNSDSIPNGDIGHHQSKSSSKSKSDESNAKRIDLGGGSTVSTAANPNDQDDETALFNEDNNHHHQPPRFAQSAKEQPTNKFGDEADTNNYETAKSGLSTAKTGGSAGVVRTARPSSAAGVRPGTAAGARPGTAAGARAAPIRLKNRQELSAGSSQNTADPNSIDQQQKQQQILIVDGRNLLKKNADLDDNDDDFIVESRDHNLMNGGGLDNGELDETATAAAGGGDHGHLVRKILETKNELEKANNASNEKPLVVVFDAKEREKTKKETAKLQEYVQQLTRTSHPLGKLVDFLQEDVDSMLKELQFWRDESKRHGDQLRQETGRNVNGGGEIENLKRKLTELDQQIAEQSDSITAVRGTILTNESRIQKMMMAVAKK